MAEDLALRVRPVRGAYLAGLAWLNNRLLVIAVVVLGLLCVGVISLIVRDAGSFSRREIDFPPVPQLDASIGAAQERLKVNPQDIDALTELGTLHFEKGKELYPDAINELESARELGALDARIFYCLGIMYQEVGLYPFALEEYKRFLRHYPEDKEIRMLEAKLLYRQGNYAEAVSEYERLKFHFPNDSLIEENLGLSLWGAKTIDRAVESFKQLKAMGPDQAKRAEFYLAGVALEQGQAQQALDHLQLCQPEAVGPGFGIGAEKIDAAMAQALEKLGRREDARPYWEKVIALAPDDPRAKAALRDLDRRVRRSRNSSRRK